MDNVSLADRLLYGSNTDINTIPNKWLYQALIFKESADTLNRELHPMKAPVKKSSEIRNPAFVLSAFTCELFLKGMLKDEKIKKLKKSGQGHNLRVLFCTLKGKTQNIIIQKVNDEINANGWEKWSGKENFHVELKRHNNAFVGWRYAHQNLNASFQPYFMRCFIKSMLDFCEENGIFDNKNPDF